MTRFDTTSPESTETAETTEGTETAEGTEAAEAAAEAGDLREAYRLASAAAEFFRVELHRLLGIDPTPLDDVDLLGGQTVSYPRRLDDVELIRRIRLGVSFGAPLVDPGQERRGA